MKITIRQENQRDYQQIAEISLLAFRGHTPKEDFRQELILGDVLRHSSYYDNDLALVAEVDGKIVGYALFTPVDIYYHNKLAKSVFLAPLAVHPEFQAKGIGGLLLNEGHKIAAEKGYTASLLFGEKDYYPRFGYIPKVFSYTGVKVLKEAIKQGREELGERSVEPRDILGLTDIWHKWYKDEPLAVFPGNNFLDWVSHDKQFRSSIFLKGEEIVGYVRYEINRPWVVMCFMAKEEYAMDILGYIKSKVEDNPDVKEIYLPLNPNSYIVNRVLTCQYTPNVNMSVHGMLKVLDKENVTIRRYLEHIEANEDNVAVIILPPAIEWC